MSTGPRWWPKPEMTWHPRSLPARHRKTRGTEKRNYYYSFCYLLLLLLLLLLLKSNIFEFCGLFSFFFLQSLLAVGGIFGSIIGGWAIDRLGRKGTIMACVLPFEFGWLLIAFAKNHMMLYSGRVINGMACGMVSLAVPVSFENTVRHVYYSYA